MISRAVSPKSTLHKTIVNGLRQRIRAAEKQQTSRVDKWKDADERFIGYLPESEENALRRQAREDGKPDYTTIMLPYSYAVAMAAHSYWSSVFLSRSPVWQFMGNNDEGEMQMMALEALVGYQMRMGRMLAPMFIGS